MNDSLQKELDSVKSETPTAVGRDFPAIVYGGLFTFLGYWLTDVGATGFGVAMIALGLFGAATGLATFVSASPKVKVFQAIDNFALAVLFLFFTASGPGGGDFLDNPLVNLGLAAFLVWAGADDLKEYGTLSAVEAGQREQERA